MSDLYIIRTKHLLQILCDIKLKYYKKHNTMITCLVEYLHFLWALYLCCAKIDLWDGKNAGVKYGCRMKALDNFSMQLNHTLDCL